MSLDKYEKPQSSTPSEENTAVQPQQPVTQQQPAVTPQPQPQPTVAQPTREQQEFLNALNDLMTSINELSFTASLLDDELLEKHPELKDLSIAVKKVVKSAWRFVKLVRRSRR